MYCDNSGTMWELMKCINDGIEIPYTLERAATNAGINIEQVKEILRDVNQKDREANYINSESGPSYKYGSDWEQIE